MKTVKRIFGVTLMLVFAFLGVIDVEAQCGAKEEKKAFNKLSPQKKAAVWQGHLAYILRNERLSIDQRQVVFEAIAFLETENLFDKDTPKPDSAEINARIKANFVDNDARKIFYELSLVEANGFQIVPVSYSRFDEMELDNPYCSCNFDQAPLCDSCAAYNGGYCRRTSTGCGFLWLFECQGFCIVN